MLDCVYLQAFNFLRSTVEQIRPNSVAMIYIDYIYMIYI